MKELKRLWDKTQENGLLHYLTHPKYIVNYSKYILQGLRKRWPKKSISLFVLAMKLEPRRNNSDIYIECINSVESMKEYAKFREIEEPSWNGNYLAELKKRFARGDMAVSVIENGKIVSHLFVNCDRFEIDEISYSLNFPKHTVGFYDAFTLNDYRGKGLYKAAFNYCVNVCYQKGFKDAWLGISPDNARSLLVHRSLGMSKIFLEVTMLQRWGLRWYKVHPLNTYIDELPKLKRNVVKT